MPPVHERAARTKSKLIDRIAEVHLRVRDIDASLRFYRDVVGLQVVERDDSHALLASEGGPAFLRLDSEGVTGPADPNATGLFHHAIRFPTRASLGDALARLAEAGLHIGAGDHLVSEALYIDDPDGDGVELYWDRPEEAWPPPSGDMIVPMATLPVDLEGLLREGRGGDAVTEDAPAGTDMGHVHLQVSDVEKTTDFFAHVVGLDVTGTLGSQAGFYSSNAYHHHIGANSWNSHGGSPAPRERAGLERVTFAVSDENEIRGLRERTGSAGDGEVRVLHPDGIELLFVPEGP